MRKFIRQIESDILCVCVDDLIIEKFGETINATLRTYTPMIDDICLSKKNCFYIIPEKKKLYYPSEQSYVICENDENWLFGLINDLDVFHTETLKCTVIHGSCIKVGSKNILIIGERWSGKTTLTHFLMSFFDGKYLSDDCVYLKNKHFFGFCMPLPMRNYNKLKEEIGYNDTVLTSFRDSDGVERTLIIPSQILESVNEIDFILFPKYVLNTKGYIKSVVSAELFKKLICNVRSYANMKEMYKDITNILYNTPAYSLEYSSNNMVQRLLKDNNVI